MLPETLWKRGVIPAARHKDGACSEGVSIRTEIEVEHCRHTAGVRVGRESGALGRPD